MSRQSSPGSRPLASISAVLRTDAAAAGIRSPGRNSFTTDGDSVYHARAHRDITQDPLHDPNRGTRAVAVGWRQDGTPVFEPVR
jgi:GH43 family beta-xylosidase